MTNKITGYKAMDKNMKCRDFQFKEGKTYALDGELKICSTGFHFCENLFDVYNYYDKSPNTIICKVEALGEVIKDGDKSVTNKIKIVEKLSDKELLLAWIKHTNSGDCNSGNYNSGSRNSGYFNTTNVKVRLFNKDTDLEFSDSRLAFLPSLDVKPILQWVPTEAMNETEKAANKDHTTTGGFLRRTDRMDFSGISKEHRELIKALPGFDDAVFKDIAGFSLLEDETVDVTINGVVKKINLKRAKELGLIE